MATPEEAEQVPSQAGTLDATFLCSFAVQSHTCTADQGGPVECRVGQGPSSVHWLDRICSSVQCEHASAKGSNEAETEQGGG
jgi:hypothetical protein